MSGRTGPRSRTGCSTCRTRKIKCDETRPSCGRCRNAQMSCEWHRPAAQRPCRKAVEANKAKTAVALQQARSRCRVLLPRDAFSLSTSQQLRNSLHLSAADREHLAYFPNSVVVAWVGKPWKWGFLHYLYRTTASESPVVMRLLLAISASELESRRPSTSCRPGTGLAHYGTALRDFRVELNRAQQQRTPSREKLDEIVTAFFFLIAYENHFGRGWAGLSTHLAGIHAFLSSCGILGNLSSEPAVELAVPSKNLLLFIMYIALSRAWGPGYNHDSWLRSVDDDTFCNFLDTLFLESRDTNSVVYHGSYPTEQLADDMSVYHPLDFFQECSKLKHRLCSYVQDTKRGVQPAVAPTYFLNELKRLGKRFHLLIMLAHRDDPVVRLRELQAIYSVVSEYHALEILCHHSICIPQAAGQRVVACHCDSLAHILAIGQRLMQRNSRAMLRLVWPLTIAAEFVDSPADKKWIQDTVNTVQQDTGTSAWLADVLDTIWARQRPRRPLSISAGL